jgi:tRNA A-37 threonylcarbamoyl transferase component Bud32/tetratricopeptide (TPR) repeat protein
MTDPKSGELVGRRYILREPLGEGGMGAVFRATDRLTGQVVALKRVRLQPDKLQYTTRVMDDNVSQSSTDLRLTFAREYKALASLRHPNIISVFDYGFEARQPYIAMELLDNPQTLTDAAANQSAESKVELVLQTLQALAYLHRRGVIHRDLKPTNVMVVEKQVKLLDFGIAEMREDETGEGILAWTPGYMSPELWTTGVASRASDLYAMGVILYEFFGGRKPFESESLAMLAVQVLSTPPDLTQIEANEGIVAIIGKLLSKEALDRYQDVADVITDLCNAVGLPLPPETAATRESYLQAAHFVGREAEMSHLQKLLDEMRHGKGNICLIAGESGVGKSRVLDELRTLGLVNHALVLRGQAVSEGGIPFQVWQGALRWLSLLAELDNTEASVLKEVVQDLPDLLGRPIPNAPEMQPQAAQARLISVVENLFKRQEQPVLVILEDLHWVGGESLALLARLQPLTQTKKLMIVGSYRDDEVPDLPKSIPNAEVLKLNRLTPEGISELSKSMLGEVGEKPELVSLLQKETEGNVFFLVEVVRALAEEAGQLDKIGVETLPRHVLTGGLQAIVSRRLNRVPAEAMPLLKVAAVGGRQLDMRIIREVMGADIPYDRLLSQCADAAVLEVEGTVWRFAHSKLLDGLLHDLLVDERKDLHRRVAEATEKVHEYSSGTAARLAYHWRNAEDYAKEEHYAALAGEQALRSGAYDEAETFLKRALELQPYVAESPERKAALLKRQLGDTYFYGFWEYGKAAELYKESLALSQQIGYRSGIAANLNSIGNAVCELGDYKEAKKYFSEGLKVALEIRAQTVALSGLTGLARMMIREKKDEAEALEYLALVTNNPATDAQTTEAAQQLINVLQEELPNVIVERALEAGKELKLRDVAQKILAE